MLPVLQCGKCQKEKPVLQFAKRRSSKTGFYPWCRTCVHNSYIKDPEKLKARARAYHHANREKSLQTMHRNHLYRTFGLTVVEYDRMYQIQQDKCKICGKHQTELSKRLAVDHCHKTGKIRALLCINCNRRVGMVENENYFTKEREYLRLYS